MSGNSAAVKVATWLVGVHCAAAAVGETSEELVVRVDVVHPTAVVVAETDELARIEIEAVPATLLDIDFEVVIATRVEPCGTIPEACDGSENFRPDPGSAHWCFDGSDNDGDGLVDSDDPDCSGVQGWTVAVVPDPILQLAEATHVGTFADDSLRPPGLFTGGLRRSFLVDPETNNGQGGAVGSLAFIDPDGPSVMLPPYGDFPILKVRGQVDVTGLDVGDRTDPIRIDIRDDNEDYFADLYRTGVTVLGASASFTTRELEIVVTIIDPPVFERGDANSDGEVDISDSLVTLGFLFYGSEPPGCLDSADADDSGTLDITDAVRTLEFLFSGAAPPPPPGPVECGPDTTPDELLCEIAPPC